MRDHLRCRTFMSFSLRLRIVFTPGFYALQGNFITGQCFPFKEVARFLYSLFALPLQVTTGGRESRLAIGTEALVQELELCSVKCYIMPRSAIWKEGKCQGDFPSMTQRKRELSKNLSFQSNSTRPEFGHYQETPPSSGKQRNL